MFMFTCVCYCRAELKAKLFPTNRTQYNSPVFSRDQTNVMAGIVLLIQFSGNVSNIIIIVENNRFND